MSDTATYTTSSYTNDTETPNGPPPSKEPPDPPCCVVPPDPDGGLAPNPDEN